MWFFELASTPATQSLEDSIMFRADLNDQVADQLMLCCLSGKAIVWLLDFCIGSLRSLYWLQSIDASSELILLFMTPHTLQEAAGLTAKASIAARHVNGSSSPRRLYIGGLADGGNASAARRAAGEALAIAALRIPGELKSGRSAPPLL